jgi:hypothetical protein
MPLTSEQRKTIEEIFTSETGRNKDIKGLIILFQSVGQENFEEIYNVLDQ